MDAVPGVTSIGAISQLPIVNPGNNIYVYDSRNPQENPAWMQTAMTRTVMPGYFETMGIPLLAGRRLDATDTRDRAPAMLINRILAESLFPGENPVGRQVVIASDQDVTFCHRPRSPLPATRH